MPGKGKSSLPSGRRATVRVKTARGRTVSQQRWLQRQLNDPYVAEAKKRGYRSRAAFKLLQLDDQVRFLKARARVVDLGAAPGGWMQVALQRGAGLVVGVDLLPIDPIRGAVFVKGDFTAPGMTEQLTVQLGGPADLVLSDMAPNTTGHTPTDHLRIMALAESALDFAVAVLAEGGSFVAKVFQGGSERAMLERMKHCFASVRHAKPPVGPV